MGLKCIIPAGGFGVRLGELTKEKPKALLPLGDKTILDHIYQKLNEIDILEEICIVANDKFLDQFIEWNANVKGKIPIKIISDGGSSVANVRGAIKGTWFGIEQMKWENENVLIMGSDNFIPINLAAIAKEFQDGGESLAVACDYKDKERAKKLIVPLLNEKNEVIDIEEKPENPKSTLGIPLIYFIKAKDLKYLQELTKKDLNNIGYFLEVIQKESKLKCHVVKNLIIDIGTYGDYSSVKELF